MLSRSNTCVCMTMIIYIHYRDLTNLVEHLTWPTGHHKLNNVNKDDSYRYSPTICSHGRGKALIPLQTRVSTDQVNDSLMIYTREYRIQYTCSSYTNTCQCTGRKHNATTTFSGWWTPKMKSKVSASMMVDGHSRWSQKWVHQSSWRALLWIMNCKNAVCIL